MRKSHLSVGCDRLIVAAALSLASIIIIIIIIIIQGSSKTADELQIKYAGPSCRRSAPGESRAQGGGQRRRRVGRGLGAQDGSGRGGLPEMRWIESRALKRAEIAWR
jgi:hypothetical protein